MISVILDILLAGIVLFCIWRGFRSGIINGILGILAVVVALYGGHLLSRTYSPVFSEMLEPFVSGIVDSVETDVIDYISGMGDEDFEPIYDLSQADRDDIAAISAAVMMELGIEEDTALELGEEIASVTESFGTEMIDSITTAVCDRIAYVALFIIAFLLISIIFSVIGNIFDLAFGLPGLENVNHILGGVLGAAKGILIILVIGLFFRYFDLFVHTDAVGNTVLLRHLMNSSLLSSLF